MRTSTAMALYGLSVDAFLEGLADEVTPPEQFGLTEAQAVQVRKKIFLGQIIARRSKKRAA